MLTQQTIKRPLHNKTSNVYLVRPNGCLHIASVNPSCVGLRTIKGVGMADIQKYTTLSPADSRLVTGRQAYFLDVLGAGNGSPMSVISFEAVERIGEPYRITLTLTHPDQ